MALTKGEIVQVLGRTVERVGVSLDDPQSPDVVTKEELSQIIQQTLGDILTEYAD